MARIRRVNKEWLLPAGRFPDLMPFVKVGRVSDLIVARRVATFVRVP